MMRRRRTRFFDRIAWFLVAATAFFAFAGYVLLFLGGSERLRLVGLAMLMIAAVVAFVASRFSLAALDGERQR